MNNIIFYKGYEGSVEYSERDCVYFGKVLWTRSLISYEGTTDAELVEDFHRAVDDYLSMCQVEGKEPEVAYTNEEAEIVKPIKPLKKQTTIMQSRLLIEILQ